MANGSFGKLSISGLSKEASQLKSIAVPPMLEKDCDYYLQLLQLGR